MDMYQKRKIRAEKKNNNQEEKLTKVVLNCLITVFPILHKNPVK